MLDLATTTSASVHTLTGSSRPGAVPPFAPIATTTTTLLPSSMQGAAADAALIDLAGRVKALAHRDHRVWDRLSAIEDAVDEALPPSPRRPVPPVRGTITETNVDGVHTTTFSTPNAPDAAHQAAVSAYEAAVAELARQDVEAKARLGHPFWEKLSRRTFRRLVRWTEQLTLLEPLSQAGLAAKASALLAVQETGNLDRWVTNLAVAVSRDAVRIATALAVESASDAELLALAPAWEASCVRCDAAGDAYDKATDRLHAISIPEALFRTDRDHRLMGLYGSVHPASGRRWFGDPMSIEALRQGCPAAAGEDRLSEIVQAYDEWQAEKRTAEVSTGYVAARALDEEAVEENWRLRRKILGLPARTMEGVTLKFRVATWCYGSVGDLEREFQATPTAELATAETASMSVLLDLARMVSAGPVAAATPEMPSLRPASLPTYPGPRYPEAVSPEMVESYRTFLEMELRFLNHEVYGPVNGRLHYWLNNPAGAFHSGSEPLPSSRAEAVLGLLGLKPTCALPSTSQAAASAA